MNSDRPFLGIILMLGFCILAPLGDAIAKLLGDTMSVGQLVTSRYAIQAAILVILVWQTDRSFRMSRRVLLLTALRTGLHIVAIGSMFMALRYLPMADALAIAFVMPFLILLLGKTFLGEEVGSHRLAACAVGFIGTLLVIQPNFASVGAAALLPLLVAVFFALFMLVTRQIAKAGDPIVLQTANGLIGTVFLAPLLWLGAMTDMPGFAVTRPIGADIILLALLGVLGTAAHLLMTWSLRFAPSATLAPMQYLEIPVATVIGWLIFRDLPNGLAGLGIVATVVAGLYVIHRERVNAVAMPRSPTPVPPVAE